MNINQKKLSIGLLIVLVGFPQISETIYTPALPNVASGLNASAYLVETTLAIYFLGFALGALLWGTISDWSGRRKAMLTGLLVYGIGTLGCATAKNIEVLIFWRFLQAFGASVGSVITQTMLRDSYDGLERTKLFAVMSGALAFSPAIGPLLGGFISEFMGWRANFWTLIILANVLGIWAFLTLPETRSQNLKRPSIDKILLLLICMMKDHALWGHILLIGATNGILFGFYQEAPFVFIEQLKMHPSAYGFFGILIAGATIIASRVSYQKSNQFSSNQLIQFGAVSVLTGGIMLTLIVLMGIFELKNLSILMSICALFPIFFGIGLIIPNSLSHALKPYQTIAGTAGSFFGGFYYFFIAGFTWIMSAIHNGTALPLPLYITTLGLIIVFGNYLTKDMARTKELQ